MFQDGCQLERTVLRRRTIDRRSCYPGRVGHNPDPSELATRSVIGARHVTFRQFRFEVVEGPDRGRSGTSEADELSIGSEEGNDLRLADPTVSRHHCVVQVTPEGTLLSDLGSTNGTTLGGFRIERAYLRPGARVGIGDSVLVFESLDDETSAPLATQESWDNVLGRSPAMRRIFAMIPRIAASDTTVLLQGETGTGKGLLASAIHRNSLRGKGPFVVVDCGAIPPTLIESELFGHEKGAFTGAHAARAGAFESANGGTVFLDEIGELPLDMQPKLLRALEERTIKRLGSDRPVALDVRVIAASNRNLREEINKGNFRSDLFYRLNVVKLRIPPLRERPTDIPLLVAHFFRQFVGNEEAEPPAALLAAMSRQTFLGNVRELRSTVERTILLGDPEHWQELNAPAAPSTGEAVIRHTFDPSASFRMAKDKAVARWEKWYVAELVGRHDNNLSSAAREARMDRNHLRELLRKHAISAVDDE